MDRELTPAYSGSGIFVLTGTAAALNAGPALVISFIISGFAAMLAALWYLPPRIDDT